MSLQQLLQAVNILGMLCLIAPTAWHIKRRNYMALSLFFALFLGQLLMLVNASVWGGDNFMTVGDGWGYCQVAVRILTALDTILLCCSIATIRALCLILRDGGGPIRSWKTVAVELAICWGYPVAFMLLTIIIDVGPYALIKYQGCMALFGESWVTFVIYHLRRPLLGIIAVFYGGLCIYRVYKKRKDFKDILATSNTGLNTSRFTRLLLHAIGVILIIFPVNMVIFALDVKGLHWLPYSLKSYRETFLWYIDVQRIPTDRVVWWTWIYFPISLATFLFFGTGQDALQMYSSVIKRLTFQKEAIPGIDELRSRNSYTPPDDSLLEKAGRKKRFSWFSKSSTKSINSKNMDEPVTISVTNLRDYDDLDSPTTPVNCDMMSNIYEVEKKV
ncbi:Pheromone a factor receptor [Yarrowia sp. C11]|nr:Pheromone a factor receptor [Yarrowia sp. C11]KAG5364644.1 Pheromone a factor receptor [Yarrowia sp. E02]